MSNATFIDVVLPLALPKLYTYAVPFDLVEKISIGQRVVVQFGRKKMYGAIVANIHNTKPDVYNPKLIEDLADPKPIVTAMQLKMWEWIANYYMCSMGEVMSAALPSALNISSESLFLYNEKTDFAWQTLDEEQFLLAQALQANSEMKLEDIQDVLGKKNVYPVIQKLMAHRLCVTKEALQQKYSPKEISFVAIHPRYETETALQALFEKLEKKPKQLEVLLQFLHLSPQRSPIRKSELVANKKVSESSLKTLAKHEILTIKKQSVSRLISDHIEVKSLENLSPAQQVALKEIQHSFLEKDVVALEGITGSGKTHIYIKLIEEQIALGKQVLYLLPEIALTAQIVMRLSKYFGAKVGIYHSKFNEHERVEIYEKVLQGEYDVVLSARSGVFLPFKRLGLIIVDEEHERSYKQFDPSPRYNARDVAIMMTRLYKVKTLLGTATLSLETYRNLQLKKFGHVQLTERHGDAVLPEITLINTIELRNQKKMTGLFSDKLKEAVNAALERKEQVIIFQNRRGFANYLNCITCNWIPYCNNCDVSLTYHKYFDKLVCHYCGFQEKKPTACKACGQKDLEIKGVGTEQIAEETGNLFPNATIERMDLDTTRRKHGHEEIIFAFQKGEIDILIGTQMVTKGLDFGNVSLVGVINADQLLSFPDFRAGERAFQLISQVSGRAGRQSKDGKVLVQSGNPDAPILQFAKHYQNEQFFFHEMLNRKQFNFPPYHNLIQVTLKHMQPETVREAAKMLGELLRSKLGNRVLGPSTPMVGRIRNQYLKQILIKLEKDQAFIVESKECIAACIDATKAKFKQVRYVLDVDP